MKIKKECNLIARCNKDEKEKITRKAKALGKSESQYIIDCCIAGTERKTDRIKKIYISVVEIQENINQLLYVIDRYKESIPEEALNEIEDKVKQLGGSLQCQY